MKNQQIKNLFKRSIYKITEEICGTIKIKNQKDEMVDKRTEVKRKKPARKDTSKQTQEETIRQFGKIWKYNK